MTLTELQQDAVRQWAAEGCGLSEIQKRLQETFDLKMTYMDVRFLIIELGIDLEEKTAKSDTPDATAAEAPMDDDDPDVDAEPIDFADAAGLDGGVSVTTDRVVRPGAVASGQVTFSDGRSGTWMLDQMGRLALDMGGDTQYRPSPEDIQDFQRKLQQALSPGGL